MGSDAPPSQPKRHVGWHAAPLNRVGARACCGGRRHGGHVKGGGCWRADSGGAQHEPTPPNGGGASAGCCLLLHTADPAPASAVADGRGGDNARASDGATGVSETEIKKKKKEAEA